ncbi:MAG TPA: hypothetical protein VE223_00185 [Nitrososphaeraceae archaeon]|nr:hypothetical protein [Nitrososphaeraceae archaeon]
MRLPFKDNDYFTKNVNSAFENIRSAYLRAIAPQLTKKKVNVMLGDGSIIQSDTFDLNRIIVFYQNLINELKGWTTAGISRSNTDDLHRLYCEFTQAAGKYHLHGYFGIQFHILQYYRIDKSVITIQKELAQIVNKASETFKSMAGRGNDILSDELERIGYANIGSEELFTELFGNRTLFEHLEGKAMSIENEFPEFEEIHQKKIQLFSELNNLLVKLYQISPTSIDYNQLMQGEEGVVIYFDIEMIKNQKTNEKDSYINSKRITIDSTWQILSKLNEVEKTLQHIVNDEQS